MHAEEQTTGQTDHDVAREVVLEEHRQGEVRLCRALPLRLVHNVAGPVVKVHDLYRDEIREVRLVDSGPWASSVTPPRGAPPPPARCPADLPFLEELLVLAELGAQVLTPRRRVDSVSIAYQPPWSDVLTLSRIYPLGLLFAPLRAGEPAEWLLAAFAWSPSGAGERATVYAMVGARGWSR